MPDLKLKDYFKRIYDKTDKYLYYPSRKNTGVFITMLFTAGGSKHFTLLYGQNRSENVETQRKIYNGSFEFTPDLKLTFRHVDIDGLTAFFKKAIPDNRIRELMRDFGVPDDISEDAELFCKALAYQFEAFVRSATQEAEDIVLMRYQLLLDGSSRPEEVQIRTKYPYDVAMVSPDQISVHQISSHDRNVLHEWSIQNRGKREWIGRRLYFVNHSEVKPRAISNYVDIPDTQPGEYIKVATSMDARRHEGKTVCHWIMIDDRGDDCFPNSNTFDFTLIAEFVYVPKKTEV